MANGYCPALLRHIADIADGNAAAEKMHIAGFTAMLFCCQNSTVSPVNDANGSDGHQNTSLTVKYSKRPTASDVSSEDNCEIDRIPGYSEWTIPNLGFKKISWFVPDSEIRKYCSEASKGHSINARGVPSIMNEHYVRFLENSNILMSEINKSLVTSAATKFGENITTQGTGGKVINISRASDNNLENGIVDMLRDLQENEMCGTPCMVGGGLLSAWDIANKAACCSAAGIDMSRLGVPTFYFDKHTQTIWGQNTAGVFAQGSVKFLGFNKYVGDFAGQRGVSYFTTVPMPVADFGCNSDDCLRDLVFDFQMRYIDCPTTIDVAGVPTTVNRGWEFILSKEFALWVQPTDAYEADDELAGTNGTLKYFFTNTTGTAASYGAYGTYV